MITLALDASTYRATIAVLDDTRLVVEDSVAMRDREVERLMPQVDTALRAAAVSVRDVGRIVCGDGPGSFTSLRIAASLAKGLAVARDIPLFAVSSMALIVAANVKDGPRGPRRYLTALDALRGESYVEEYVHDAGEVAFVRDHGLVPSSEVPLLAAAADARAVGPDQAEPWSPHARGVALMGQSGILRLVDAADWEPRYGRLAEAEVRRQAVLP